jgi:hypothetical protein
VETLHPVEIPHAWNVLYFHRMRSFRGMRSFHVNRNHAKRALAPWAPRVSYRNKAGTAGVKPVRGDRSAQLGDQLLQFLAAGPDGVLPVADEVASRVGVIPVEVGAELGGQHG